MGATHIFDLIQDAAANGAASHGLQDAASLVRVFDGGRAVVAVPESDARRAFIGWFPRGYGGGIRIVTLPSEPLVDFTFEGDAFTFHFRDGRRVSVTWEGVGQLDYFLAREEQRDATYFDRLFFNLEPRASSGGAVSAVAGALRAQGPERAYYGYTGELTTAGEPLHLLIRAINESQLRGLVPSLDRTLATIQQAMDAARRHVVERGILTSDEVAPLPISEMVFYDGGAFDLVMGADEESQRNGVDFFTIHFDLQHRPFDFSPG